MAGYNTEQRRALIDFLYNHNETPYTIEELIAALQNEPNITTIPGRSTVYRLMTRLVDDGIVKRFVQGHSRHFYYQIVTSDHCHEHIHMKCTACGKLYHMNDRETEKILSEILNNTSFIIDKEETTLYGTCAGCNTLTKRELGNQFSSKIGY